MADLIYCRRDPTLQATVLPGRPLIYSAGADTNIDRPSYVRAGSGLAELQGRLAVIQDDALFVGLVDPLRGDTEAVTLPAGHNGQRQFDDLRGNKAFKLDLEACVAIPWRSGEALMAFGSGSTNQRESIIILTPNGGIESIDASRLYGRLGRETTFSGSELNIEGAVFDGTSLLLFNRGNGAAKGDLKPVNARCRIGWEDLLAYLSSPESAALPNIEDIQAFELGAVQGAELSFTDAALSPLGLLYVASAEDSPDATRDGAVTGSAVGLLNDRSRWIELRWPDGELFRRKVEGVAAKMDDKRLWLVVDVDDPTRPSELHEAVLSGPW